LTFFNSGDTDSDGRLSRERRGSPDRILDRYPLLGQPAKVCGAIAFYLDRQAEIDAYLEASEREFEAAAFKIESGAFGTSPTLPHRGT